MAYNINATAASLFAPSQVVIHIPTYLMGSFSLAHSLCSSLQPLDEWNHDDNGGTVHMWGFQDGAQTLVFGPSERQKRERGHCAMQKNGRGLPKNTVAFPNKTAKVSTPQKILALKQCASYQQRWCSERSSWELSITHRSSTATFLFFPPSLRQSKKALMRLRNFSFFRKLPSCQKSPESASLITETSWKKVVACIYFRGFIGTSQPGIILNDESEQLMLGLGKDRRA